MSEKSNFTEALAIDGDRGIFQTLNKQHGKEVEPLGAAEVTKSKNAKMT